MNQSYTVCRQSDMIHEELETTCLVIREYIKMQRELRNFYVIVIVGSCQNSRKSMMHHQFYDKKIQ